MLSWLFGAKGHWRPSENTNAFLREEEERRTIRLWHDFTFAATQETREQAVLDYLNAQYGEGHFGAVKLAPAVTDLAARTGDIRGSAFRPAGVVYGPPSISYQASLSPELMAVLEETKRLRERYQHAVPGSFEFRQHAIDLWRADCRTTWIILGTPFILNGKLYNADPPISSSKTPQTPMP
jgi:hypothetical protein